MAIFIYLFLLMCATGGDTFEITIDDHHPVGYIRSPNFPDKYPKYANISYNVVVKSTSSLILETMKIKATFEMFAVEITERCISDVLEIINPNGEMTRLCGYHVGKVMLFSDTTELKFNFASNGRYQDRGFSIRLERLDSTCVHEYDNATEGHLSSPSFPSKYGPQETCIWSITVPDDKGIKLQFDTTFDVHSDALCSQDYLLISPTADLEGEVLKFCGDSRPKNIYSKGNKMIIKFVTNCCDSGKGFKAKFTRIEQEKKSPLRVTLRSCPCGQENQQWVSTRIVGGQEVRPPHRYPWLAAVSTPWGEVFCGAALINSQYLVTASHCFNNIGKENVKVLLGAHSLKEKTVEYLDVDQIILHENYTKASQANDIGLIRLKKPITGSKLINRVCLPSLDMDNFDNLLIAGWGRIEEGGRSSDVPLQVNVPQVPNGYCLKKLGSLVTNNQMCAGGRENQDSCQGDSGGPLITRVEGKVFVTGVVSYGASCGRKDYPAVYTRVNRYLDWIRSKTADAKWCLSQEDPSDPQPPTQLEEPIQPNIQRCGVPNKLWTKRVVGGQPTHTLEFPWIAAIGYRGQLIGSGVLIAPNFVLTSAKKIKALIKNWDFDYTKIKAILGANDVTKKEKYKRTCSIKHITFHPLLGKNGPNDYDFALLELTKGVPFRPICLPRVETPFYVGDDIIAAGWGRTSFSSSGSSVLLKVTLSFLTPRDCSNAYLKSVTESMVCASAPGKGMCYGDEGAPLMIPHKGRMYLAAIMSWGSPQGCALPGKPSVFADVRWALGWISSVTGLKYA